jgi:hypothetical protein
MLDRRLDQASDWAKSPNSRACSSIRPKDLIKNRKLR